jgi:prevent-host-death family protein
MQTVNVAELKNNLSHYLRQVRQGNEITIKDRHRVIARIVPAVPSNDYEEDLLDLAAQGKLKLPEKSLDEAFITEALTGKLPRLKTRGKAAREILKRVMDEERGRS